MEEKEKNQDIFSLKSNLNTLYCGNRNHQVRRINLNTMDKLINFEPPHLDAVTSLAFLKDTLISGSRDNNLKVWGLDSPHQNLKSTTYGHGDWINTLESIF